MSGVPFGSFGFKVEVSAGDGVACFQEVSGLSVQLNVEDVAEGGLNNTTHKIVTGASYSNIVLKRGMCDTAMYSWIKGWLSGGGVPARLTGTISILGNNKDEVVKKFKFVNGIPVKWDGPSLNVTSDAIATETLEIAHEGLIVE